MPSVLAIVSKAVFEKQAPKGVAVGQVWKTDRYVSNQAAFAQVGAGDAIYLVTVRPPDEALWLVAVLTKVKRQDDAWVGVGNRRAIADITAASKRLRFATGTGITAKPGALGMSLQTPRVLTADDVALLQAGAAPVATAAVTTYRAEVAATPSAQKARAKAAAAATGAEVLRLVNHRRPFTMLDQLAPAQRKQLTQLTRQNRAGKPEKLVGHEDWAPMQLVDVLDVAANQVTHQLYVWPWGSGELFVHDTTTRAAAIIQHGFDQAVDDVPFRRALAAAYARAAPPLAETVDFRLDRAPVPPRPAAVVDESKRLAEARARLAQALGKSKQRFRSFAELTTAQQEVVKDVLRGPHTDLADVDTLGLPPATCLRGWAGLTPPNPFELLAGDVPVWRWLHDAAAGGVGVGDDQAIAAVTRALSPAQAAELAMLACDPERNYDLFHVELQGERKVDRHHAHVIELLARIVDGADPDAALSFAAAASRSLAKKAQFWLAAIASFALAARARRLGGRIPAEHAKLVEDADFLGHSAHLGQALRPVLALVGPPIEARGRS